MSVKRKDSLGLGSRALQAISHPLRNSIQCILYNRVASSKEMAGELNEDLRNVSYHVRDLKKGGSIELVGEGKRRGATERYYRAVIAPFHDEASWAKLSRSTRESISSVTFQGLVAEATCALDEKTFDARLDRHLSRVCMQTDERGRREALECQNALLERMERIKAESAERLRKSGERGTTFLSGIIGVDLPPGRGLTDRGSSANGG